MPEGHLIHRLALDHHRTFAGAAVEVTSPQGRFRDGARRLDGRRLERVEAYGKHLFYRWEGDEVLHVHLGMQGKFLPADIERPPLRQARMRLEAGNAAVELVAPGVCQLVGPQGRNTIVGRLGPDPLRDDADPNAVRSVLATSQRPLWHASTRPVGGVGRRERPASRGTLRRRYPPRQPGDSVPGAILGLLWTALVDMMRRGVAEGRIITVRRAGVTGEQAPEPEGRYVYKQERCRRCGTPVESWLLAGRTAYACPRDQPPPRGSHVPRPGRQG